MGRKRYSHKDVSTSKTKLLNIPELLVLDAESNETAFYAVHSRYFTDTKCKCPACGSDKTRCSKVVKRKFKDILIENDKSFEIIDLFFFQRYLRCDGCGSSVFSEKIDFAERGSRYTNRLSDKLADGTFRYSYKKVCNYYGVPTSTASVGAIMRRRVQNRDSLLPPLKTPTTLCITEIPYFDRIHPVIFGLYDDDVYCLDVLDESSEATYIRFFRTIDASQIQRIYIDPIESLRNATYTCFPAASICVADECLIRYASNAMKAIVRVDGKRFPIRNKYATLTKRKDYLSNFEKKKINDSLSIRPRLEKAYEAHQKLLLLIQGTWSLEDVDKWLASLPDDLFEFDLVSDLVNFYRGELQTFISEVFRPPNLYPTAVKSIYEALEAMPYCIYDLLRARSFFNIPQDTITENDAVQRLGIRVERFINNINEITNNIKEDREYGL